MPTSSSLRAFEAKPVRVAPAIEGVDPALYDEDYYERGVERGISGYSNYRWIPELTIPMAMTIIDTLGIKPHARVLDFGCAKGFTVKALRMLRRDAKGVDISPYAISQTPHDVIHHCRRIEAPEDLRCDGAYDYAIAKDVLEHVPHECLDLTLESIASVSDAFMAIVPLGVEQGPKRFVIEAYERDITHVIREPASWWRQQIEAHWRDVSWRHHVDGIKDNWNRVDRRGNAVFIARGSRAA